MASNPHFNQLICTGLFGTAPVLEEMEFEFSQTVSALSKIEAKLGEAFS
jgi:hypothetical protein